MDLRNTLERAEWASYAKLAALTFVIAILTIFAGGQAASAEPAVYEGATQSCPQAYPGSFLDIGRGDCWSCPSSHPKRTIFAVDSAQACERPGGREYKRASGPRNPTGIIKTDCPSGYFLDIGLGKCYSCGGWSRSVETVKGSRACFRNISVQRSRAKYKGTPSGCPDGSFNHLLSGRCYSCPAGTYRNANTGTDPSTFNACTRCGNEGGKPCPVTTLRKSCDDGLEEHFIKGICVPSTKELLRRDAMDRIAAMGPELSAAIERALVMNEDEELKSGLEAKSPHSASYAEQQVEAAVNPCFADENQTWTLGAVAQAGAIANVALETGMAVDVSVAGRTGSQRPAFAYGGAEYGFSLGGGLSGGVNYGCWRAPNNALGGDYHGVALDVVSAAKAGIALSSRSLDILKPSKQIGPSLVIGFWYDPHGGDINPARDYLGFTITAGAGIGSDLTGISYVRGSTGQVTGAFPPPIGNDKVFGSYYVFASNSGRRNEFVMQGPNQMQVRAHDVGSAPGAFHTYRRDGFSPNVFRAAGGAATYTINDDGSVTWRRSDGDANAIVLNPVG
ncbi:MAG: hypothetical protein WA989_13375 [Henriciella sp.]|uniref:hypothetical protein n=1 Tax=Henriciella sp. TaxID=1968823 RepID=UPI003C70DECB